MNVEQIDLTLRALDAYLDDLVDTRIQMKRDGDTEYDVDMVSTEIEKTRKVQNLLIQRKKGLEDHG